MPLSRKVRLDPSYIVLDGDPTRTISVPMPVSGWP